MLGLITAFGVAAGPVLADEVVQMPAVEVVGTTPLPGLGLRVDQIPAPVQTAKSPEIVRSNAFELPGFMNRFLGSVYVNDIQGNPFQPDVTYRGYVASPLLGTPQGLSVYMDGVRLNQPFGDVVSWDLIPLTAISSIVLEPGSNPLFGLNTLGGALSIQTKDGRSNPGTTLLGFYGQYNRASLQFESGGAWDNGVDAYATGNLFREDGWRDDSPSRVGQVFTKIGWHDPCFVRLTHRRLCRQQAHRQRTAGAALSRARLRQRLHQARRHGQQVAVRSIWSAAMRSGTTFCCRATPSTGRSRLPTFNGDINDDSLDQALYQPNAAEQAALAGAGYTGFPTSGENAANTPFPYWRCIANALLNEEPNEKCNGLLNSTNTTQSNWGASGQITVCAESGEPAEPIHRRRVVRRQPRPLYPVDAIRLSHAAAGRYRLSMPSPMARRTPKTPSTVASTSTDAANTLSFYATDTLTLARHWNITLSGRYNRTPGQ